MLIDVIDGEIRISEGKYKLTSIQLSQLRYFGFRKNPSGEYYAKLEDSSQLIGKTLAYFIETDTSFELSQSCKEIVDQATRQKEQFNLILKSAREYKNGNFDQKAVDEFNKFIDGNIYRKLRDHQKKAAYHHYLVRNAANFSVPGSGKTSVVLAVYEKLKQEGLVNTLYIVGPPACFGPWKTEFFETLGRKPNCHILAGGDTTSRKLEYYCIGEQKGDLYLTTFQTLLNDLPDAEKFCSNKNVKVFLVIDEAHYIKQIGGEWSKAVLDLAPYAKYRCILTGTPLPKSFTDVFNLYDFLFPNTPPFDSYNKSKIMVLEKEKKDEEVKSIFQEKAEPLSFRVRKKDLGLIPAIFHPPVLVEMNKYEKILYDAIVKKIKHYSLDDYLKNIDLVTKLMKGRIIRLRQIVSYSKLLTTAIEGYDEDMLSGDNDLSSIILNYDQFEKPAKLIKLLEMVDDLQNKKQKVVIWSNFRESLKLIRIELLARNNKCEMIFGDTPTESTPFLDEKTRDQIRDEFVSKKSGLDILIANPAACAESISLHKTCFHAIYYDLSYNCAQYLQSLDRIHRVGGSEKNQANYYFLQYKNTIDEDILLNLNTKAQRMYSLIEEEFSIYSLDMFSDDEDLEAYRRVFGA